MISRREALKLGSAGLIAPSLGCAARQQPPLAAQETGGSVPVQPVVADNTVFIHFDDGNLYAINATSGEEIWRFPTRGNIWSYPAVADGIVYVNGGDNAFLAIDAVSGEEYWRFVGDDSFYASPAVTRSTVFAQSGSDTLYAIDSLAGTELWRFAYDGTVVTTTPAVVDGMIVGTGGETYLYVLANLDPAVLASDVVLRAAPSESGVERGVAKAGDEIQNLGSREERDGEEWVEVTIGDVTGWIPLDAIDPATLSPEGEIEYVYIPE